MSAELSVFNHGAFDQFIHRFGRTLYLRCDFRDSRGSASDFVDPLGVGRNGTQGLLSVHSDRLGSREAQPHFPAADAQDGDFDRIADDDPLSHLAS
jgi:hypothetical protein